MPILSHEYDVVVVGGGLHGTSMASECAGHGLQTLLIQGRDLASGASAGPATVVSGDLRKLEGFDLIGVRTNLDELSKLEKRAPHLVSRLPFHIVANESVRSSKRVGAGLMLYKKMAPAAQIPLNVPPLPDSLLINKPKLNSTQDQYYNDFVVRNSRLIICSALQAHQLGADILPYHRVSHAERSETSWQLAVEPETPTKSISAARVIRSKIIINCCGWLANDFLQAVTQTPSRCRTKEVCFGLLILRNPFSNHANSHCGFVLQHPNKSLIYVSPYGADFLSIGPVIAKANDAKAHQETVDELLEIWNQSFSAKLSTKDVVKCFWSRRAMLEDPSCNTGMRFQESLLDLNNPGELAPLLNLFGIHCVRYHLLAKQAIDILKPFLKVSSNQASQVILPGGDFGQFTKESYLSDIKRQFPFLQPALIERLVANYGSIATTILSDVESEQALGRAFGHLLYEKEVTYLLINEWARTAEDILWRRTCLGIKFTDTQALELDHWIKNFLEKLGKL